MHIITADESHMDLVRVFFREYRDTFADPDACFINFEEELANLPGDYAPPKGAIYIAYDDEQHSVGCAAIRPTKDPTEVELRRVFVRELYRSHGIGHKIFTGAMDDAHAKGYRSVKIETLQFMEAANHLYQDYGFKKSDEVHPDNPEIEIYRYVFGENDE